MRRYTLLIFAVLLSLSVLAVGNPALTRAASTAGSLDPAFGSGGKVLTNLGIGGAPPRYAVLQSNGDIVVSLGVGGVQTFALARYLPNGSLDTSFGRGGIAAGPSGSFGPLAIQPDGKIVVAGEVLSAGGQSNMFAVTRFNTNGNVDTSFGNGGVATVSFSGPGSTSADSILVQPNGKILVGGSTNQVNYRGSITLTAIARFTASGSPDAMFGSGGTVLASRIGNVVTMGLDPAGDIFLLNGSAIAELSPAGTFDVSVTSAPITASSPGNSNVFLANGQYVSVTTVSPIRHDVDVQVQRLTPTGSVDPAFSSPGIDYTGQELGGSDSANSAAIQPNGQIVTAGAHFLATSLFGVARVNTNGSLDSSFGNGGVLTTTFFGNEGVGSVLIQPDGKIVAVGYAEDNSTGQVYVAIARYLGN